MYVNIVTLYAHAKEITIDTLQPKTQTDDAGLRKKRKKRSFRKL